MIHYIHTQYTKYNVNEVINIESIELKIIRTIVEHKLC